MITYAFIFARGGSKGVPGKNIRPLAGKPLLAYSIEIAKNCGQIEDIFVSTNDNKIKNVALGLGAQVIDRPSKLAQDDSPEWLAWQHATKFLERRGENFDVFLSLPTTAPLRNAEDVNTCLLSLDKETDIVLTMTEAARSPYFNMVQMDNNGYLKVLIENESKYIRRQDTPKIYDLTTVAYVTRPKFIKEANGIFEGRVKGVKIPNERALDIDTELDFQIAEFLMIQAKKSKVEKTYAE